MKQVRDLIFLSRTINIMTSVADERIEELESRLETLELMVDEKFRSKVEEGLKDEREGRVRSLDEYEEERDLN